MYRRKPLLVPPITTVSVLSFRRSNELVAETSPLASAKQVMVPYSAASFIITIIFSSTYSHLKCLLMVLLNEDSCEPSSSVALADGMAERVC